MNKIKNRCVHIFPRFENNNKIEAIRAKFDNLYNCIEPHITLIFPFKSSMNKEVIFEELCNVLSTETPFELRATKIKPVESHGYYLFLSIDEGKEIISKLHYKLHKGLLSQYQSPWTIDGSFEPHITVGRFKTKTEMDNAFEEVKSFNEVFRVKVDRLYVEIIGDNEESIIEGTVLLGKNYEM